MHGNSRMAIETKRHGDVCNFPYRFDSGVAIQNQNKSRIHNTYILETNKAAKENEMQAYTITTDIINDNKVLFTIKESHTDKSREFQVYADKDGLHISSPDRIQVLPMSAVSVEVDNV